LRLYAGQQAAGHLQDAVVWAEKARLSLDQEQQATIHAHWGRALQLSGRYDEAQAHLEQALPLVQGEQKQEIIFWICQMEAIHRGSLGKFNRLVPALEQELADARERWASAALSWTQGYFAAIQGQLTRARKHHSTGWLIARRLAAQDDKAPPLVEAEGHVALADCHERWADWRRTIRYARQALATFEAHHDLCGIAHCHLLLQAAHYGLGEWEQARDHFERCYSLAVEGNDLGMQGHALYYAGRLCLEQGDWTTAQEHAHRILDVARSSGDVVRQGFGQVLLARLAMRQGRPRDAIPTLQSLERMARAEGAMGYVVQLLRYLAEAELLSGEIQEAPLTAQDGIELAQRCGYKREWSGLLRILGQAQEAERPLLKAIALAERIGCRYNLAEAHRGLGKLYAGGHKTQKHLETALALFESMGAEHDIAMTQQLLFSSGVQL
jgi:tetratricopeptide (TPR) repeat protein